MCLVGGRLYATANVCSHAFSYLSDGEIDGYELVCAMHGGSFDVRTGEAVRPPCEDPIATYPLKEQDGALFVLLDAAARE